MKAIVYIASAKQETQGQEGMHWVPIMWKKLFRWPQNDMTSSLADPEHTKSSRGHDEIQDGGQQ